MKNAGGTWAIVLAGGRGQRLEPFLRRRGHDLPIKQFCAIIGRRTMLQHTWRRVEMVVPPERLLTVVDASHCHAVRKQLAGGSHGSIVYQPANRETAPGTLLPLAHVLRADPQAIVAIFPADHFVLEEGRFMKHVEIAQWAVRRHMWDVVVLGVMPDGFDPDYGWIEVSRVGRHPLSCLLPVARFWEKPSAPMARSLYADGHLWSTMVTVARADVLWGLICETHPALQRPFERIRRAVDTGAETAETHRAYAEIPSVSLSSGVFAQKPSWLATLCVRGVHWSDWGQEGRIQQTLQTLGKHGDAADGRSRVAAEPLSGTDPGTMNERGTTRPTNRPTPYAPRAG